MISIVVLTPSKNQILCMPKDNLGAFYAVTMNPINDTMPIHYLHLVVFTSVKSYQSVGITTTGEWFWIKKILQLCIMGGYLIVIWISSWKWQQALISTQLFCFLQEAMLLDILHFLYSSTFNVLLFSYLLTSVGMCPLTSAPAPIYPAMSMLPRLVHFK